MADLPNIQTSGETKSFHDQLDELRKTLEENLRYTQVIHQFTPKDTLNRDKEFKKLLSDNFEYTKGCYAILEKLHRWLFWHKILIVIKFLVIYVPILVGIVLGIIYFPPFFEKFVQPYLEIMKNLQNLEKIVPR